MSEELTIENTNLPADWEIKTLGDVSVFSQGIQVGLKQHITNPKDGYVRFIRIVDYTQNTEDIRYVPNPGEKYFVDEDDIVMVRYGSPGLIGRGKSGVIANNLFRIKINIENLTNDYLSYFLSQYKIQKYLSSQGSATMPALNFGQLKTVDVLFPKSIPQQKQIVSILDQAFAAIDRAKVNAEQNLQNAKELFESYLQNVFENKGDDWKEKTLQEVCHKITDGTHQTPKYFDEGVIFLSSRNVTSGKINWDKIKYIDEKQHIEMHKRVAPKIGDILLAKNGTTGVAAMVDKDVVFDIYVSLAHIRSLGSVNPEFLLYFINSPVAKKQFNNRLKGAGVPNLHLKEIREVVINFPKSIGVQKQIVKKLDSLSAETKKLESIYIQKLADLEEMKKSVLQKAFSGQLNTKN